MTDLEFIKIAVNLSNENNDSGAGKPFGAIVVKNGEIIGKGVNQTLISMDPTSHSEMLAIRTACQHEKSLDLTGCAIYCSSEPCPMCTAAIHLARVSRVVYSVSSETVAEYEFSDKAIYEQLSLPKKDRKLRMEQMFLPESVEVFKKWIEKNIQSW
jgi:guanine deaminase